MTKNTSVTGRENRVKCISFPFGAAPLFRRGIEEPPKRIRELMKRFRGGARPCIHVLTGRFDGPRLCTRGYECEHCGFDQMLDEINEAREA